MLTEIWEECRYNHVNENLDIFAPHWILLGWQIKAKKINDTLKTLYKIEQYYFRLWGTFKDNVSYVCGNNITGIIVSCWQTLNAVNMEKSYLKT